MTAIVLKSDDLQATFLPEKGMNLVSLKKGEIEVIDQSTRHLFEERYAGLGALIGPHFHRRPANKLPTIKDESLFPHIARVKAKGVQDPFSHGIARYAPWKAEANTTHLQAKLSGDDTWNGIALSALEGQNFTMRFDAELRANGLFLQLSISSDSPSVVGIHYYYALPQGPNRIISAVQKEVGIEGELKPLPSNWPFDSQQVVMFDLKQEADFTFRPFPNPLEGHIVLATERYQLHTRYTCPCAENCWQLYHPLNASFACIEPISTQNPRHPHLNESSLNIHLEILT